MECPPSCSWCTDYKVQFHEYEDGNLSREAAFDVEPLAMVLAKRSFPEIEALQTAVQQFHARWLKEIESHHTEFSTGLQARTILDIGCSTGSNTRCLRDHFQVAQITGLDLSPYFLAVAQYIEKQKDASTSSSGRNRPIQYLHANAEDTGLPSESFDIVSIASMMPGCPQQAVPSILREAHRLLKPGGTIAITDQSPQSKVVQNLPPALYVMWRSTEPWMDEFHGLSLQEELARTGFNNFTSVLTTPRHFTVTATAV